MSTVMSRFLGVHHCACFLAMIFVAVSPPSGLMGQAGNLENDDPEFVPLLHDYDQAVEQAQKMDRPILVILGAVSCGPCKQLEKDLELPIAASIFKQWIAVKVDIDEEPGLVKEWQVSAVPILNK